MTLRRTRGPAATAAGPRPFPAFAARWRHACRGAAGIAVLAGGIASAPGASAADWVPPRPVSALLPGATIAPGNAATLELVLRAEGATTSLEWIATASGNFVATVVPASGALVVPANGIARIPLTVGVPVAALGLGAVTVHVEYANSGGRAATANASIIAATNGRPEIWPVSPTWSGTGGTSGSVQFRMRSQIGTAETVVLTSAATNPDPNNQGALFAAGPAPTSAQLPPGGTVTVTVPATLPANAWAGSANAVQTSVTSNEGISTASVHAIVETAVSDSLPMRLRPVGLVPTPVPPTGRDGPVALPSRGAWLLPVDTEGIRVWRASGTDSIGMTDRNADGTDDRLIGTIRIPSVAAALAVVPGYVTAAAETLDVGLVAAGRAGLMVVDLRVIEDPTFGAWEDFFDQDGNGVDDRVLRTIPMSGFATDVAWTRSPSGRVVAFVAAADSGSSPVSPYFDPAAVVAGSGAGVVAVDVSSVIDSLAMLPVLAGTWNTPGSALDVEIRGSGGALTLAVADGASGLSVADVAIGGGAPATATFAPRAPTPLATSWGAPYARDVAWLATTGSADYAVVAAGPGGLQIARVPSAGAPTVVVAQQTGGAPMGLAAAWPGLIAAAQNGDGVALFQAPSASQLDQVTPAAAPPYTAPVVLARHASWPGGSPLELASFASPAGGATSLAFEPGGTPVADLFVSDRVRVLVLRPGSLTITAVDPDPSRSPPSAAPIRLEVLPNPSAGVCVLRASAARGASGGASNPLRSDTRIEIVDVRGRLVRVLEGPAGPSGGSGPAVPEIRRVWDGRDRDGRRVASGRYWARLVAPGQRSRTVVPLVIVR